MGIDSELGHLTYENEDDSNFGIAELRIVLKNAQFVSQLENGFNWAPISILHFAICELKILVLPLFYEKT